MAVNRNCGQCGTTNGAARYTVQRSIDVRVPNQGTSDTPTLQRYNQNDKLWSDNHDAFTLAKLVASGAIVAD